MDPDAQIEAAVDVARRRLGGDLIAVYLYGSATEGGLRRWSDLDLLVLVAARPQEPVRRGLMLDWLPLSGPPGGTLRPLEVTALALGDVRPWRYPPWRVLQFGEWLRADLAAGRFEPPLRDPDVALLVTNVLRKGRALLGPPPGACLDQPPQADLRRALADLLPSLLQGWTEDARNAALTLARMWLTAATGEIRAKDAAADWAIARLEGHDATWLARARADYLGEASVDWPGATEALRPTIGRMARRVAEALGPEARSPA